VVSNAKAQFQLQGSTELGHTNVSEGMYLRSSLKGTYSMDQFKIQSAIQNELISYNSSFISGFNAAANYRFNLQSYPLQAKLLFLQNILSNYVSERNYAALLSTDKQKLNVTLGLGFKTIGFTKYARKHASISSNKSINENFNLLYDLNYSFLKSYIAWELKLGLSNFDEFTINQATNPMLFANAAYKINNKLQLTTDICYKTAGSFNLHVNYFGFYIRPGIIWKIN
jgi:hypothetical protein